MQGASGPVIILFPPSASNCILVLYPQQMLLKARHQPSAKTILGFSVCCISRKYELCDSPRHTHSFVGVEANFMSTRSKLESSGREGTSSKKMLPQNWPVEDFLIGFEKGIPPKSPTRTVFDLPNVHIINRDTEASTREARC